MHLASLFVTTTSPGSFAYYFALTVPYLALGAFIFSLLALVFFFMMRLRMKRLALGKSGSLEETLAILSRNMKELEKFRSEMEVYLKHVEARVQHSTQGVGFVRFNPFPTGGGGGGNQSFAVAFIDEKLSGVVLSTLYARDRVGVYGKPIEKGISTFELTAEEKEAIEKAKQSLTTHAKREA
ncbi:MAG: DUF4446 family protein [bacterium]